MPGVGNHELTVARLIEEESAEAEKQAMTSTGCK